MKKTTILKTILMAAAMMAGSQAWAQTVDLSARTPSGELYYLSYTSGLIYGGDSSAKTGSSDPKGYPMNYDIGTRHVTANLTSALANGDIIEVTAYVTGANAVSIYDNTTDKNVIASFESPSGYNTSTAYTFNYTVVSGDGICGTNTFSVARVAGKNNVYIYQIRVLRDGADDLRANTLTTDKTWTFDGFNASSAATDLVNDDLYYFNGAGIEAYSNVEGHSKAIKLTNSSVLKFIVPAGTGKVEVQFLSSNGYNRTLKYKIASGSWTGAGTTNSNKGPIISFGYSVTKDTEISLASDNANRAYAASISVKLNKETVNFGDYGYASYSCPNAIDLTDVTTATAYVASSVGAGKVTMTPVTGTIPAGTGLILKGTPNSSVNIPFASAADPLGETNLLKAVAQAPTTIAAYSGEGTGTNYVMTVQDSKVVFASIGATSANLKAGQAYLQVIDGGAPMLTLSFADETTGIQNHTAKTDVDGAFYNLNGIRVEKPTKGIYVKNGKKFVVK